MKMRLSELRRLIREALEGDELALYVWEWPSRIKVVLYSPAELLALDWSDRSEIPKSVVKGYAGFHQPEDLRTRCNDAWAVSSIAGIGHGKLLYGLGYWLVPSHRLMPDRMFSSKRAKDAWGKQVGKLKSLPLDDIDLPREQRRTPDDLSDDCELQKPTRKGGPDPVLDAAYEDVGIDPAPMVQVHKTTVRKLMSILNKDDEVYQTVEEVEKVLGDMLKDVSTKYFTSEFEKYYKEK